MLLLRNFFTTIANHLFIITYVQSYSTLGIEFQLPFCKFVFIEVLLLFTYAFSIYIKLITRTKKKLNEKKSLVNYVKLVHNVNNCIKKLN